MNLIFAFAVNEIDRFENKNFSEASKFLIFKENNGDIYFEASINNPARNKPQPDFPGKVNKEILEILKKWNVNILVARKFGEKVALVNDTFIPVKIEKETPGEVVQILREKLFWIKDEMKADHIEHKLFTIKKGILKTDLSNINTEAKKTSENINLN